MYPYFNICTTVYTYLKLQMEQFKDIHIPSILGNSYNLRLSDHSSQYNEAFNFGQDWPAILDVQNNNSVPIHKCPSRMHQVLWGQNDSMIVRLFLNNKASQLGQVFGTHDELLHHPVYTSDAFPQTTSSDFPKYARRADPPGHPTQTSNNKNGLTL